MDTEKTYVIISQEDNDELEQLFYDYDSSVDVMASLMGKNPTFFRSSIYDDVLAQNVAKKIILEKKKKEIEKKYDLKDVSWTVDFTERKISF